MRQEPLRLHAGNAEVFEQNGEARAFRDWLQCHRPELTPETQQALVRHLARAISAFGPATINTALFDLTAFERRLRLTVAVEPTVPAYAARHWKRAIRHFVAAAYGMTGREATRVLDRPRQTLTQARRADAQPFELQRRQQVADDETRETDPRIHGDGRSVTGPAARTQPSIDQLVEAARNTWAALERVGDPQPVTANQLIAAQLSCLSMPAKTALLVEAGLAEEPVPVDGPNSIQLADLVDDALTRVLQRRLALTPRETAQH